VRYFFRLVLCVVLAALAAGSFFWWWLQAPLSLRGGQTVALEVPRGSMADDVAVTLVNAGVVTKPFLLRFWFHLSGKERQIKAGYYDIPPGTSPRMLLTKLVRGEQALQSITLIEGWTFQQVRRALAHAPHLKPETQEQSDEAIMAALDMAGTHPEGRFFPDTYRYGKGSSDLAVLRSARDAMNQHLAAAWALRTADTPLQSPEEALILASIIEKETGLAADRARISGVFSNRLRDGMLLQTDPSVIYGLGDAFSGTLRRSDLVSDTPWNTYLHAGLPPTPIAMPGKAALLAAVQPEATSARYFVARGDGSSHFSDTLEEHHRAVQRYVRSAP